MLIMFPSVYFYDSHQGKCRVQEMWYALRIAKKKKLKEIMLNLIQVVPKCWPPTYFCIYGQNTFISPSTFQSLFYVVPT